MEVRSQVERAIADGGDLIIGGEHAMSIGAELGFPVIQQPDGKDSIRQPSGLPTA
jgi:hypothetical protein